MNILQVIESSTGICYLKKASTKGGEYSGACPWCGGTDRFSIHPAQNHYVCRQCKRAGDSIQFLKDHDGKTYIEACVSLGVAPVSPQVRSKANQTPGSHSIEWTPRKIEFPLVTWQEKAQIFLFQKYKFLLSPAGKKYREWLNARGIKNSTIKKARFGYNTQSVSFDRSSWGLPQNEKQIWIPAGLIIPQFYHGKLIRLRIRQEKPTQNQSRFIMVAGSAMGYFDYSAHLDIPIIEQTTTNKPVFITEAELDGWLINQEAGDLVRVYSIGNASARPDIETDKEIKKNPGLLNVDNDEAGHAEIPWWHNQYRGMHLWFSAKKKDPGEDFKAGVPIRQWILEGLKRGNFPIAAPISIPKSKPAPVLLDAVPIKNKPIKPIKKTPSIKPKQTNKICMHGLPCVSAKNGICLRCKQSIRTLERCPRDAWWLWRQGNGVITEIILGPGIKKI